MLDICARLWCSDARTPSKLIREVKLRRIPLAAAAGFLAVVVAAGCSSSGSSSSGESSSGGSGKACSGTGVTIGVQASLSGPGAALGEYVKQGSNMALTEINKTGGFNGKCVALTFGDDKGD